MQALKVHDTETDENLHIAAACDGDPAALKWLVERWTPPLYRFSLRMLRNEQDAMDAAQDSLSKILKNLHRFDQTRAFSTWAYRITRNTCIDQYRRNKRMAWDEVPDVSDGSPLPDQVTSAAQRAELLGLALDRLPPLYREVLVLYHFDHLKYCEIAETLDVPMGTVMNRIFRARRKLRDLYVDAGGEA
ncbi:MAG: RNA polymerase sigma factor [Myxococcota bacterium]